MNNKRYDETSIKSIEVFAKQLQNKRLVDFIENKKVIKLSGKGQFGQYLEKYFFEYDLNNKKGVDFEKANLELKTGGVYFKKGVLFAKERLSIGFINFSEIIYETFYSSTLFKKLENTLFVYYEYRRDQDPLHYKIRIVGIHKLSPDDIQQIKKDWELIKSKVQKGEAHLISGGDTEFLEASTTGSKNQKLLQQPNSSIKAKPRRFALKSRYMTTVLNQMYFNNIITSGDINVELLQNLIGELKNFKGKTFEEISSTLFMETSESNKARYATISRSLVRTCLDQLGSNSAENWEKFDYKIKTVRISKSLNVEQSLSFPKFDPKKLVNESWETSKLSEYLENNKYLFIFWQKTKDGYIFDKAVFWNMPAQDILEAKKVWQKTIDCLKKNDLANLPKIKDNKVCHVRPKARNSQDTTSTHLGTQMVKSTFWINATYIRDSIYDS